MADKVFQSGKYTYVTYATLEHAAYIGARLRGPDRAEIWASHRMEGEKALPDIFRRSDMCLTVIHKDVPVVMFGTVPFSMLVGAAPWALGTDGIEQIKLPFVRYSRDFVRVMLRKHHYLMNYADARNTVALEWLRFCGFKIEDAQPYGPDQIPFHRFTMGRG